MKKSLLRATLVLMILAIGGYLSYKLATSKPKPKRYGPADAAMIVETVVAKITERPVVIQAIGSVSAAREVTLLPEVTGRVVFQDKRLVPGGRFESGEVMVRIDPRDYDLAIESQLANVSRAEVQLAQERSRKAVAEREWDMIGGDEEITEEGKKLALRELQLDDAKSALKAANSNLSKARLQRHRTSVHAPFNALVTDEFVDRGQVVGPGTPIAKVVDSDLAWVKVSLPVSELPWISQPDATPVAVSVVQNIDEKTRAHWPGKVGQILGTLDSKGKMARIIVEVERPFEIDDDHPIPLLIGSTVNIEIQGPTVDDAIEVPRHAIRGQNELWLFKDGQLEIAQVELLWTDADHAFVRGAVSAGDRVITSRIATPVKGMSLLLNGAAKKEPVGLGQADTGSKTSVL